MEIPAALRLIGASAAFCIRGALATPLPLYSSLEGSADEEELGSFTSSPPTSRLPPEPQTTPVAAIQAATAAEPDLLGEVVNFLEENMLLILVASTLVVLLLLVACAALFMSRRRKVNAYYPCSYPSKMYVDHRDKNGGAKPFNEVPEKPAPEQESEPVDSHKQLQADIMRAAKSLRTPNKSVDAAQGSRPSQRAADHSPPEDASEPDGGIADAELQSVPESQPLLAAGEAAAAAVAAAAESAGGPEVDSSEQQHPARDESLRPPTGRSARPSSLHIHNDSATLQLIAGEKTAF